MHLICTTPLFYILASACFGSSLSLSESFLDPSELPEIQIEWVVYHIMCSYMSCVSEWRGSVCCVSHLSGTNQCSVGYFYYIDTLCGQKVEFFNVKLTVHIVTTAI
jgi:hypothetical protein